MDLFFINILTSIIAGVILLVLANIFSMKIRWLFISIFSKILDIDIDYVFPNKKAGEKTLKKEISKAKFVCIFAGRGNELKRDTFTSLFMDRNKNIPTKILLPKTQLASGEYDWLMQREKELASFDNGYGQGLLHNEVQGNVKFIKEYIQNNKIELQEYNYPNIGRMIITDRCLFYTPYKEDAHGRHSKVYEFRKNGELYYNFLRLFNQLWNANDQLLTKQSS